MPKAAPEPSVADPGQARQVGPQAAAAPSDGPKMPKNFAKRSRPNSAPWVWRFDYLKLFWYETLGLAFFSGNYLWYISLGLEDKLAISSPLSGISRP